MIERPQTTPLGGWWLAISGLSLIPIGAFAWVMLVGRTETEVSRPEGPRTLARHSALALPDASPPRVPAPRPRPPAPAPAAEDDNGARALIEESRAYDTRDPLRSRQLLRDALAIDPDNVVALRLLTSKLLVDEDHEEARELAERCRQLGDPDCEEFEKLTYDEEAIEWLGNVSTLCMAKTPSDVECLYGRLSYHLAQGEKADAAVLAGRLTQVAPSSKEAMLARGRVKGGDRQYRDARQLFEWSCALGDEAACFRQRTLDAEGWTP
jgi:hypothetical protein